LADYLGAQTAVERGAIVTPSPPCAHRRIVQVQFGHVRAEIPRVIPIGTLHGMIAAALRELVITE
jgi:hypothetical protein